MTLSKENRLTKKKDLDRVFKKGKTVKGSFLFIRFLENDFKVTRYVFIVSSKICPKAVDRNRLKRVLSEKVRSYSLDKGPIDIAVVAIKRDKEDSLVSDLVKLLDKIN